MRKLIALSLIIISLLTFCACGAVSEIYSSTLTYEGDTSEPAPEYDVYLSDIKTEDIAEAAEMPVSEQAEENGYSGNETDAEAAPLTDTETVNGPKPRKFFTICFDDGITQDMKIIEIFKKHGFNSCTFFINTGLYGANWKQIGKMYNRPDVTHIRFTKKELESGIYNGFDVAVHTLTHKSLKAYDKNPKGIRREVENDAENIFKITGVYPVGMAWPGGENDVTETTKKLVYENTSIRFARGAESTHSFELPTEFLMWQPTCSIRDPEILSYARSFMEADCAEDMLFFVWGHGYELDLDDSYDMLDELIKMMTESEDIICVTTTEFYELFKDQIPSLK